MGNAGWLDALPGLIAGLAERWELRIGDAFPGLTYNYVTRCSLADGRRAVLKVCFPGYEFVTEVEALRLMGGQGAAALLAADGERLAFLLERLEPGTPLESLRDDEEATRIAAGVMRRLWRPLPEVHPFPTTAKWALGLSRLRAAHDGGTGPFAEALVAEAEETFAAFLAEPHPAVLLHGDLHHGNILQSERGWLAIDPKGLAGEAEYEVGALLMNPRSLYDHPTPGAVLERRLDILAAELGFERERLRAWGMARSVLSACWALEDHGSGWEFAITCAELLSRRGR